MSHTFTPPPTQGFSWVVDYFGETPPDADPLALRLMGYFAKGNRCDNVYIMQDGTVTTTQPPNWNPNDPTGPYAWVWNYAGSTHGVPQSQSFTNPASQQVRAVFYGGHTSPVSDSDYTILAAAGYTAPALV